MSGQTGVSGQSGVSGQLGVSGYPGVSGKTGELSNPALKTLRLSLKSYCGGWWWVVFGL